MIDKTKKKPRCDGFCWRVVRLRQVIPDAQPGCEIPNFPKVPPPHEYISNCLTPHTPFSRPIASRGSSPDMGCYIPAKNTKPSTLHPLLDAFSLSPFLFSCCRREALSASPSYHNRGAYFVSFGAKPLPTVRRAGLHLV